MNPDFYLRAEMRYHHERISAMFADANARRGRSRSQPHVALVRRRSAATPRTAH